MTALTDEQAQQLIKLAAIERNRNGRLKYPQWRPRNMRHLSEQDYEETALDALRRCFEPPDPRPQSKRRNLNARPSALGKRLHAVEREFDPVRYFWHCRLKEAFRQRERDRKASPPVVTLDEQLEASLTIVNSVDATTPLELAEAAEKLYSFPTDTEREIAILTVEGYRADDIKRKSGATFHQIREVRKTLKQRREQIDQERANVQDRFLRPGCSRTLPSQINCDSDEYTGVISTGIDRELQLLFSAMEPTRPSLSGWKLPKSTLTPEEREKERQEIRDARAATDSRRVKGRGKTMSQIVAERNAKLLPKKPKKQAARLPVHAAYFLKWWSEHPAANDSTEPANCGRAA